MKSINNINNELEYLLVWFSNCVWSCQVQESIFSDSMNEAGKWEVFELFHFIFDDWVSIGWTSHIDFKQGFSIGREVEFVFFWVIEGIRNIFNFSVFDHGSINIWTSERWFTKKLVINFILRWCCCTFTINCMSRSSNSLIQIYILVLWRLTWGSNES